MTSKLTREQLLEIIETDHVQCGEASYLARMALAAMDSEPVVWVMLEDLTDKDIVSTPAYPDINDAMEMTHGELEPLYRHAQQPVVPEVMYWQDAPVDGSTRAAAYATGWNACRAAMLNGGK